LKTTTVFAPGHLTGLFQICDSPSEPLKKGARGSGVSLELGTTTTVYYEPSLKKEFNIFINGKQTYNAIVSEHVINHYFANLENSVRIKVEHQIKTPIQAGFASSGGGALSLSLALNHLLNTGYNRIQAAQVAHIAEIECKTGLGSVYATNIGGFGVLTKPGGPGIGESFSFLNSKEFRVIFVYYGPMSTKETLSNPNIRKKINQIGGIYVDKLIIDFTPNRFLCFSRKFTEKVGLATPRLRRFFNKMDVEGIKFTMAMFGEVAFTVQPVDKLEQVLLALSKIIDAKPIVTCIDEKGASFQSN
jgi:pantoate kinase